MQLQQPRGCSEVGNKTCATSYFRRVPQAESDDTSNTIQEYFQISSADSFYISNEKKVKGDIDENKMVIWFDLDGVILIPMRSGTWWFKGILKHHPELHTSR